MSDLDNPNLFDPVKQKIVGSGGGYGGVAIPLKQYENYQESPLRLQFEHESHHSPKSSQHSNWEGKSPNSPLHKDEPKLSFNHSSELLPNSLKLESRKDSFQSQDDNHDVNLK